MVKPSSSQVVAPASKAVQELVASVRSNVEVIRDALKVPASDDSHAVVSELMLEVKQSQEKLQKKASELAESGQFDNTNEIFEAIDQVTQLEPEFENWSKRLGPVADEADQIGANIHVDENVDTDKPKKKRKKKRKEQNVEENVGGGWEAFPAPPGASGSSWPASSVNPTFPTADQQVSMTPLEREEEPRKSSSIKLTEAPQVTFEAVPPPAAAGPAKGRITLGMTWDMIGPLLGDPGSTDEARKLRLAELIKEAIASECGISQSRINITRIS